MSSFRKLSLICGATIRNSSAFPALGRKKTTYSRLVAFNRVNSILGQCTTRHASAAAASFVYPGKQLESSSAWMQPVNLTPKQVVEALSNHIVGQMEAKKAIAIALRNRWRRMQLNSEQQDEIIPKNILMVGPTGCGKTEIARRLAKLCKAPFVKVEATKFTEVGYHGRDVDTIIKDLMDASLTLVKELRAVSAKEEVGPIVENKLIEALTGPGASPDTIASFRTLLQDGVLEDRDITVDVPVKESGGGARGNISVGMGGMSDMEVSVAGMGGPGGTVDLAELMSRLSGSGKSGRPITHRRNMTVREARIALEEAEVDRVLSSLDLRKEAVTLAEQNGIVFIDEIDKLISNKSKHSGDASSEGVQRDLLPLIEGTTVDVKRFGNVRTDYMLFVASGAFHAHKPSELLAELQGRLPIRVELQALTAADLERILRDTRFNLIEQQTALLATEGVTLNWDSEAITEIARLAAQINKDIENIGARRLHTVIEKVLEDVSFDANELVAKNKAEPTENEKSEPVVFNVSVDLVKKKLLPMLEKSDFSKFIL